MDNITGTYHPVLVALSVMVSVFGSFTSLQLMQQIRKARAGTHERWFWVTGAAVAMGAGAIWSMHFVGMVAFELPLSVRYDLLLTVVSLIVAVTATGAAYLWVERDRRKRYDVAAAGLFMGLGISGMHFTGMAAMRMRATITYDPVLVTAAVAIGIAASTAALVVSRRRPTGREKVGGAVILAGGVSGMHYTAMAAAEFRSGVTDIVIDTPMLDPKVVAYGVFLFSVLMLSVQLGLTWAPSDGTRPEAADRKAPTRLKLLRRSRLWGVWSIPLVAAAILGVVGWLAQQGIQSSMRERVRSELQTVLNSSVTALEIWASDQTATVTAAASLSDVVDAVSDLDRMGEAGAVDEARRTRTAAAILEARLAPFLDRMGYVGWTLVTPGRKVLDSGTGSFVEDRRLVRHPVLAGVWLGEVAISDPFRSHVEGESEAGPSMFTAAPVRNSRGQVIAALLFRLNPSSGLGRLLRVGRMGNSGESYAFNRQGVMVSASRFEDQLRRIGLLPSDTSVSSALNIQLRDPGGDLTRGYSTGESRGLLPLTRMAAAALAGQDGIDLEGYRDYRGVQVVGAWNWIPVLNVGVATEIDKGEAYRALYALRRGFWGLFSLLVTAGLGLFVYSVIIGLMRRRVRRIERLGQYHLDRKIGEGGMGKVYLGRHSLLRRPTAVKLIRATDTNERMLARFEREVQFTARLAHPNTIAIYDYGRTHDGVFYYAMEYLPGITLERLLLEAGPLPEERAVHILTQVCGSLAEAHDQGMIHRDIKPANIMVIRRAGLYDFVKVLDFGLVREVDQTDSVAITHAEGITGTPLFMSPEAITSPGAVDPRTDIYALGCVAYFLVTGKPVFTGESVFEVCGKHVNAEPESPSSQLGRVIDHHLEETILACLAKNPNERPQSARSLEERLSACERNGGWTQEDARLWWENRSGGARVVVDGEVLPSTEVATGSEPPLLEVDLQHRT